MAPVLLPPDPMTKRNPTPVLLATALALAACGNRSEPTSTTNLAPPPPTSSVTATASADPHSQAKDIFATRCTPCHGAEGRGDGAASASLNPRPRNFHDAAWLASINDDHLTKIIQYGGAAVGKSPTMPANPDLKDAAVIQALAAHVRTMGKNP
jgi:mono/diheme cytochrome c family protein